MAALRIGAAERVRGGLVAERFALYSTVTSLSRTVRVLSAQ
jgi:hypothetical protein